MAIGIVNCGVRNECDPAKALLTDYVMSEKSLLRIGSILGNAITVVTVFNSVPIYNN